MQACRLGNQLLEQKGMESEALKNFISRIVQKHRRERYVGYLNSKKGIKKLLAALDHDLENDFELRVVAKSLSKAEWESSAIILTSAGKFKEEYQSVREAYDKAPWEGGWVIISESALYGIYRPEGRIDNEVFIKL